MARSERNAMGEPLFGYRKRPPSPQVMELLDAFDRLQKANGQAPSFTELAKELHKPEGEAKKLADKAEDHLLMFTEHPGAHRGRTITDKGLTALKEWRNQREAIA